MSMMPVPEFADPDIKVFVFRVDIRHCDDCYIMTR